MSRASETQVLKCERCKRTLAKNGGIKCPRCGQIRPFPILDENGRVIGEQHSDVSLTADINMIHREGSFEVRVPRYNFHKSVVGNGENPDLQTIRNFLRAHNVEHEENGGAVVTFSIHTARYQITSWVDARSHGFRIRDGNGLFAELSVENREIIFSTTAPIETTLCINGVPIAKVAEEVEK